MSDYGDYRDSRKAAGKERIAAINKIEKEYGVKNEWAAIEEAAGVNYIEDPWTYLFFARCVSQARDMSEDFEEGREPRQGEDYEDYISEAADSCVPHQTYVLWSIWLDCGYEDDYLEEMDYTPELGELYKIPQIQLYGYAERIIAKFAE